MNTRNIELNAIVAICSHTGSIGHEDGRLPWKRIPEDFKHFKRTTSGEKDKPGYPLIMGRKTFETFPKPLPGRPHIILSRDPNYTISGLETQDGDHGPMIVVVNCIKRALDEAIRFESYAQRDPKVFVIGGGEIYKLFMGYFDKLIITKITPKDKNESLEAPVKFPNPKMNGFKEIEHDYPEIKDDKYICRIRVYTR
jgi:dihydrofolate reductase